MKTRANRAIRSTLRNLLEFHLTDQLAGFATQFALGIANDTPPLGATLCALASDHETANHISVLRGQLNADG